jgi:hypothetical protein
MSTNNGHAEREKATGSSNAGGSSYLSEQNFFKNVANIAGFFREYGDREEASYFNTRGMDYQHKPPNWMEHKDVAVDGTPLSREERRDRSYWERVYEKELAVGAAIAKTRQQQRFEALHSVTGSWNALLRRWKLAEPLSEKQAVRAALNDLNEQEVEENIISGVVDKKRPGGGARGISEAWEALVVSVDSNRPMAKVAREYRPRIDFFGIDPFIDNAPSFIWFCTKIGMYIGLAHGTIKTLSVINVDAQFLRASGVGILSLLNVTVFANVVKWGGNMGLFATAFTIGDRLATMGKKYAYPQHDANQRSVSNYSLGLSMSCATIGTLPWWVLNDVRFAVRLASSGMFIGGCLGVFVGLSMERLVALNLGRLDASPRDLRNFEALMKRESIWKEHLAAKHGDGGSSLWF